MIAVVLLIFIYAVLAISVLCSVLDGRKSGLFGVLLRIGVVLLSGVLAFVVAKLLSPMLLDAELSLLSMLGLPGDLCDAIVSGEGTRALIGVLCGGVLLPFVFAVVAVVLMIAGTIVVHCTSKKLPKGSRGAGMGVGAVHGILIALVMLFPLMSFQGILNTAVKESPSLDEALSEALGDEIMDSIDTASSASVPQILFGNNIVKWTVQGLTSTKFEGEKADTYTALYDLCAVVETAKPLTDEEDIDLMAMTPAQRAKLDTLLGTFEESALLSTVLADIVSPWAEAWSQGEPFMDMEPPEAEASPMLAPVYRQIFLALAQSNRDNIVPNIKIMLNAVGAWAELGEGGDRLGQIMEILGALEESEELAAVAVEIKIAGMKSVLQSEIPALEDEDAYNDAVNEMLSLLEEDDPQIEVVAAGIRDILAEHGYELADEDVNRAADLLIEKRREKGEPLSEAELADMWLEYFSEQSGK